MKKEISDITGFIKVTADGGMVLTFFKDGVDTPDMYIGIKTVHVNNEESLEGLREITYEQHREYMDAKEHYIPPTEENTAPDEQ